MSQRKSGNISSNRSIKNGAVFKKLYIEANKDLCDDFGIETTKRFFSSNQLKKALDMKAAIAYCNKLVERVSDAIDLIHITYIVLPPKDVPEVQVGGNKCPVEMIRSEEFIRKMGPSFSYITAWDYLYKHKLSEAEIHLDGFRGKRTIAWDEMIAKTIPKVYPHGDECNCFISLADIIAFLTDVRLYQRDPGPSHDPMQNRGLRPNNVQDIWKKNGFGVECHFIDQKQISKIAWYSNENIDITRYLARPVVFFLTDQIEKTKMEGLELSENQTKLDTGLFEEPKRFTKVVQNLEPFHSALSYAEKIGGCLQMFDRYVDSDKVRDGDIIVYMGEGSKRIAQTYSDGFDVEIIKAKDLRRKVKEMEQDN